LIINRPLPSLCTNNKLQAPNYKLLTDSQEITNSKAQNKQMNIVFCFIAASTKVHVTIWVFVVFCGQD